MQLCSSTIEPNCSTKSTSYCADDDDDDDDEGDGGGGGGPWIRGSSQ